MRIIENTEDLKRLCSELEKQPFITVDSEFVRERTYYSKLCLIQVGWTDDAAIIDPLANCMDLSPFLDVLLNEKILKVFHSGRQDIEIFYHLSGKVPTPVFDTQIAAMVCGFGPMISYDNLVQAITHVELDKSSRLTDWSKRPLNKKQLEYALRDVTFLIPCYQWLANYLKENNREHWIEEELQDALLDEDLYKIDPESVWRRLHYTAHSGQFLMLLKHLAAWRERRAIDADVPRQNILKDEILVNVAALAPRTVTEMLEVRSMRPDVAKGKLGQEMLGVIDQALSLPIDRSLKVADREKRLRLSGNVGALFEVLKLLLKVKSEQLGVVAKLVASDKDLSDIACKRNDKTNPALIGWRYDLFGKDALALRAGKASIAYDTVQKEIKIIAL